MIITTKLIIIIVISTLIFFCLKSPLNKFLLKYGGDYNGKFVLHDAIHAIVPPNPLLAKVSDWMCIAVITVSMATCLLKKRFDAILFFILGIILLQFTSLIFFASTILPDPKNGDCKYSSEVMTSLRNMGSCNNLGISGHLMTSGLALYVLSSVISIPAPSFIGLYAILFFIITASRNHYTLDCLTSTVVLVLFLSHRNTILDPLRKATGGTKLIML